MNRRGGGIGPQGARAQLDLLLYQATPEAFERFSVETLARRFRVKRNVIQAALYEATQARRARGRGL